MNKTAQDLTWNCLPFEVKKEAQRQYQIATNAKEYFTECTLEYLFGIHNLTSDAEGEEMLTVSRKRVQEIYTQNQNEIIRENVSSSDKDCYETVNEVLKTLFGSKCLPDEPAKEPQPAEPTCTDDVPTCTDDCSSQCSSQDFDTIIKDGFSKKRRLNIAAMMMQGMLSNTTRFSSYEISDLVRISLNCADALIAEVEKGGSK